MCRLIETICIKSGELQNIKLHAGRMNMSGRVLFPYWTDKNPGEIIDVGGCDKGKIYKCRLTYDASDHEVEISEYTMREIRFLRLLRDDEIEYSHKYADRLRIEELFEKRDGCDDVLIAKNGLITDTSIANIAFFDGHNWITPAKPLLKGTKRQLLIEQGIIIEGDINADSIGRFSKARIFNAMIEWGAAEVETGKILI